MSYKLKLHNKKYLLLIFRNEILRNKRTTFSTLSAKEHHRFRAGTSKTQRKRKVLHKIKH